METKSNEAYTYYQRFRITCETVVNLAESKAVYVLFLLVFCISLCHLSCYLNVSPK